MKPGPISIFFQERVRLASSLKANGNAAYQQRKFSVAVDLYTRAIEVSPKPEPVFYSNRAACPFRAYVIFATAVTNHILGYVNMSPPKHELVVADCDEALKLDTNYVKALNRRATALEGLHRYEEALRGALSACCTLCLFN